jgi:protein-disulfide isomerase-like protein with CxxC motif
MNVDFYFDPACPWTWITSRWIVEVAPERDLDITWKTFSLRHRNRESLSPNFEPMLNQQWRGLRVIEAARAAYGNESVGRLYTAIGARIHHDGDTYLEGLAEAVAEADVDDSVLTHADDASWDHGIELSTDEGHAIVGDDVGIPIIVIDGSRSTFFGPVVSPAPAGDDALKLWDAFQALSELDGVYEIKRSRSTGPQFGPRPGN